MLCFGASIPENKRVQAKKINVRGQGHGRRHFQCRPRTVLHLSPLIAIRIIFFSMTLLFPSFRLKEASKLPHCKSILGPETKVRVSVEANRDREKDTEIALNTLHLEPGAHFLNPLGRMGLLSLGGKPKCSLDLSLRFQPAWPWADCNCKCMKTREKPLWSVTNPLVALLGSCMCSLT